MPYLTITLALLRQTPKRYQALRHSGTLRPTLEQYAATLKDMHMTWTDTLRQQHPERDPAQLSSQALELAVQELRAALPSASAPNDTDPPLSLDAAMAFLRRHTPPA